jgi:hypothetical protein
MAGKGLNRGFFPPDSIPTSQQQIMRLRAGLRQAFRKAGLSLDPSRVLVSEVTLTNEVRYRLRASVNWQHSKF